MFMGGNQKNSIYDVISDTYKWLNTNKLILKSTYNVSSFNYRLSRFGWIRSSQIFCDKGFDVVG